MTQRTFGYGSLLWCNVGITSAGAKAFHLHNNGNLQWHLHRVAIRPLKSGSNQNLEMLVFEERGKPEYPEKNLSEQRREPTTNSTHILR